MKWFKHIAELGDDPVIDDSVTLFGADGYYVFFRTLEVMSKEFDPAAPGENFFSIAFFSKKFRLSWRKVAEILAFFDGKERIFCTYSSEGRLKCIRLKCPELVALSDEWTRKITAKNSGVTPARLRINSLPEEEEDKDKEQKTAKPPAPSAAFPFPLAPVGVETEKKSSPLISGAGKSRHYSKKLDSWFMPIKALCDKITGLLPSRKFNPHAFVQQHVNRAVHPQAILEAVEYMAGNWPEIENPWSYGNSIVKTKSGNYREREHTKQVEQFKAEWKADPAIRKLTEGLFS